MNLALTWVKTGGRGRAIGGTHAGSLAVILRGGGAVPGVCGFFVRPVEGTTMGHAILPEYRGHGLATEAATVALNWAEQHDVDVYASVRPPNPASVRVLAKIGMRAAGRDAVRRRHQRARRAR